MKKALRWTLLLLIVGILIWTFAGIYTEKQIKKGKSNTEIQKIMQEADQSQAEKNNIEEGRNLNLVPKKYKGYAVAANLKIKKLNIDTCVLSDHSETAMDTCITKFYGPDPNEAGNFCIAGHNYITKNMFGYLYKLKIGDTFTLTDNSHGVVEYKIYDKYRAEADETYRTISKN